MDGDALLQYDRGGFQVSLDVDYVLDGCHMCSRTPGKRAKACRQRTQREGYLPTSWQADFKGIFKVTGSNLRIADSPKSCAIAFGSCSTYNVERSYFDRGYLRSLLVADCGR